MVKKGILLLILFLLIIFFSGCPTEPATISIFGTWSCDSITADGVTNTALVFTLNEDGSFLASYEYGGANTQTGTLSPATLPGDTTITATVVTSSGPNGPPPGTTWLMRYSNLTASTVGIEFDLMSDGFEGPFTFHRQ